VLENVTVEQLSSITRALREAGGTGMDDAELTRRLTCGLMRRYPGMRACEALVKINRIRQALEL